MHDNSRHNRYQQTAGWQADILIEPHAPCICCFLVMVKE